MWYINNTHLSFCYFSGNFFACSSSFRSHQRRKFETTDLLLLWLLLSSRRPAPVVSTDTNLCTAVEKKSTANLQSTVREFRIHRVHLAQAKRVSRRRRRQLWWQPPHFIWGVFYRLLCEKKIVAAGWNLCYLSMRFEPCANLPVCLHIIQCIRAQNSKTVRQSLGFNCTSVAQEFVLNMCTWAQIQWWPRRGLLRGVSYESRCLRTVQSRIWLGDQNWWWLEKRLVINFCINSKNLSK